MVIKNLRQDYGEKDGTFEELITSLDIDGPKEAMKGFRNPENPEEWFTISGHTRTRAAHELFKRKGKVLRFRILLVPVKNYERKDFIWDMYLSNKQREMNILEVAEMVKTLITDGETKKSIAERMGKHTHFITNLEILANSPLRMRTAVRDGVISYSQVVKLMQTHIDPNAAIDALEKALGFAKLDKKKGTNDIEDVEGSEIPEGVYKVTAKHIAKAENRVDSFKELCRVFKSELDGPKDQKDPHLYSVLKRLAEHKLTAKEIEAMLF